MVNYGEPQKLEAGRELQCLFNIYAFGAPRWAPFNCDVWFYTNKVFRWIHLKRKYPWFILESIRI